MTFEALEISLRLIRSLRRPLVLIRKHDPKEHDDIRRAAGSVAHNLSEGRRRRGKDRIHHWRIAAGSAEEVGTGLRVAESWGFLTPEDIEESMSLVDRLLAMCWRMTE